MKKEIWLVASGDSRLSANQKCWQAQSDSEAALITALKAKGYEVTRAHGYDPEKKHGFIDSQKMGIAVFRKIPANAFLIVAESVWQYSHHVLAGLTTHQGPILTLANWSGQWPGLVGMLNLNGSLTKQGVVYSTLWTESFNDDFFNTSLDTWLNTGILKHNHGHVKDFGSVKLPAADEKTGREFAKATRDAKAIMGIFDEGCMGMFNAIIPDDLLHATGIFKERLSQSALYAKMLTISEDEARTILVWLQKKGMKFVWGTNEETELTERQTLEQCKMYIAALRIADEFGCDTIGIQYQQGLRDLTMASDLVEGLLNNKSRPPAFSEDGRELYAKEALPHFNEVDECAGIDTFLTYNLWKQLGMPGENTLHDIRWGEHYKGDGIDDFVWTFMISGAVPPEHIEGGYTGVTSLRQNPMYFRLGGGTIQGVSKAGNIVWSRVYVMDNQLHCDLGVGKAISLPEAETVRRQQSTSPEWPIMHAVLSGCNRDQLMGRHKANHIQVVYVSDKMSADQACRIKGAALAELGVHVHFCGDVDLSN